MNTSTLIAINQSTSSIMIPDLGSIVISPTGGQYNLSNYFDIPTIQASRVLHSHVSSGNVFFSDGYQTLNTTDSLLIITPLYAPVARDALIPLHTYQAYETSDAVIGTSEVIIGALSSMPVSGSYLIQANTNLSTGAITIKTATITLYVNSSAVATRSQTGLLGDIASLSLLKIVNLSADNQIVQLKGKINLGTVTFSDRVLLLTELS